MNPHRPSMPAPPPRPPPPPSRPPPPQPSSVSASARSHPHPHPHLPPALPVPPTKRQRKEEDNVANGPVSTQSATAAANAAGASPSPSAPVPKPSVSGRMGLGLSFTTAAKKAPLNLNLALNKPRPFAFGGSNGTTLNNRNELAGAGGTSVGMRIGGVGTAAGSSSSVKRRPFAFHMDEDDEASAASKRSAMPPLPLPGEDEDEDEDMKKQPSPKVASTNVASAVDDSLEAYMSGLAGSMTETERKAISGEAEAEERKRMAEETRMPEEMEEEKNGSTAMTDAAMSLSVTPSPSPSPSPPATSQPKKRNVAERYYGDEESLDETTIDSYNAAAAAGASWLEKQKALRRKDLKPVDHSKMNYPPFRKDLYIESRDMAAMSEEEVRMYRETALGGVKIRGKNCPKPIKQWIQCGLPDKVLNIIRKEGYKAPFPIQAQAIPAIMSGRDVIACAKTGSGKCWAPGTKLMMYNGQSKAVEHIVPGDVLMGDDSTPRMVQHGSLVHSSGDMFEIKCMDEGRDTWRCNGDHILVLAIHEQPSIVQLGEGQEYAIRCWDIQLGTSPGSSIPFQRIISAHPDYAAAEAELRHLMSTQAWPPLVYEVTVYDYLHSLSSAARLVSKMYQPPIVHFPPPTVSLAQQMEAVWGRPFAHEIVCAMAWGIGVWLSNEQNHSALHHKAVSDMLLQISAALHDNAAPLTRDLHPNGVDSFPSLFSDEHFRQLLQASDIHHHPHLPLSLLTDNVDVRRAILAGIIDGAATNAHSSGRSQDACVVSVRHERLMDGVIHLARGLGFTTAKVTHDTCTNLYRTCIVGDQHDCSNIPTLTHTKLSTSSDKLNSTTTYDHRSTSFTVTPVGIGEYYGFTVDGNGRFLLHDFIVTHNTLAFLFPLLRHVQDQPPSGPNEGCIALVLAPTRELATQIYSECAKFARPLGLRAACVYGGAGVAEQIAVLKRGADIIVATPGRMIDMLCANSGRLTNLARTTFVTLDEADRMFDMGFEPQVCRILDNIRPDRQTVMFSATFPKSVETLAKRALKNPLEIIIGGRSVASSTITQFVEVRTPDTKFNRLLELLGKWYPRNENILIFTDKQESVDQLFRQLIDAGYPCLSLHGGMDQSDRDFTIADFKSKLRTIMVATSIVARGLDVKDLTLVINYEVPNHYEDYVHRVGRTGRAGKSGTAITFIQPDQLKYAPDLVRGLVAAKQVVPNDLQKMADEYEQMRKEGKVKWASNDGYITSKGYKFNEAEDAEKKEQKRLRNLADNPDADPEELAAVIEDIKAIEEKKKGKKGPEHAASTSATAATTTPSAAPSSARPSPSPSPAPILDPIARQLAIAKEAARAAARALKQQPQLLLAGDSTSASSQGIDQKVLDAMQKAREAATTRQAQEAAAIAQQAAAQITARMMSAKQQQQQHAGAAAAAATTMMGPGGISSLVDESGDRHAFFAEVEINDYPQHARWKVTHKGALDSILELTDCAVTTKGSFIPQGRQPQPGERKLHLLVEGKTELDVQRCKTEIIRILEEAAADSRPDASRYGKYSVV